MDIPGRTGAVDECVFGAAQGRRRMYPRPDRKNAIDADGIRPERAARLPKGAGLRLFRSMRVATFRLAAYSPDTNPSRVPSIEGTRPRTRLRHVHAYSDEAGRGFRFEAGRRSEAKPATIPI